MRALIVDDERLPTVSGPPASVPREHLERVFVRDGERCWFVRKVEAVEQGPGGRLVLRLSRRQSQTFHERMSPRGLLSRTRDGGFDSRCLQSPVTSSGPCSEGS